MVKLTIDNHTIEVNPGTSVLEAAKSAGIIIPTMCYLEEAGHVTSCMVCLVKNVKNGHLFASCSTPVSEGQILVTNDKEVLESRQTALELLLSEHVGDCEAPCQLVCPAHMNIPLMNRLIAKGEHAKSLEVVKRDIALPAILGRICPAPCEAGCRRKQGDGAVAICKLKQFVADEDLDSPQPYRPENLPSSGRKIAIIGAGPAGLSAAWYLQLKGHQAVIFEKSDRPGGALLQLDNELLPGEAVEKEIAGILAQGVQLRLNETIDSDHFQILLKEFDAIIVAAGTLSPEHNGFGLEKNNTGLLSDKLSYASSHPKVFVIGNSVRTSKMAVRSVGQGKEVAWVIDHLLCHGELRAYPARFNSKFGLLAPEELVHYQKESEPYPRQEVEPGGFIPGKAIMEAQRCMHCDCRNPESCVLRELSDQFRADQKRFNSGTRKRAEKFIHREGIIYEPGKCIKCGICVRLTTLQKEELGLTFIGRGFDVRVGVPFDGKIGEGLKKTALIVAKGCPTGALSMSGTEEQLDL